MEIPTEIPFQGKCRRCRINNSTRRFVDFRKITLLCQTCYLQKPPSVFSCRNCGKDVTPINALFVEIFKPFNAIVVTCSIDCQKAAHKECQPKGNLCYMCHNLPGTNEFDIGNVTRMLCIQCYYHEMAEKNKRTQMAEKVIQLFERRCQVCNIKCENSCAGCHSVYYCSKTCQKADWKSHKKKCQE